MSKPILYILARTDLASLNPGKCAAQVGHSANQMVFQARAKTDDKELQELLYAWEHQTVLGFGTCLVLGVKVAEMYNKIGMAVELGLHSAVTHDPTYPLLDGETCHFIPLDTCAYIFCDKEDATFLSDLKLLP